MEKGEEMASSSVRVVIAAIIALILLAVVLFYFAKARKEMSPVIRTKPHYLIDPMYYEKRWEENLFIPFREGFVKEIAEIYPECRDLPVKDELEAQKKAKVIRKCIEEVALVLEAWKFVEKGETNVNLSYLKPYGFDKKTIGEIEEVVKKEAEKIKKSKKNPVMKKIDRIIVAEELREGIIKIEEGKKNGR